MNPEDIEVKIQREPISTYDSDHDRASYYLEINPPFDTEKEAIETKQQILENEIKAKQRDEVRDYLISTWYHLPSTIRFTLQDILKEKNPDDS